MKNRVYDVAWNETCEEYSIIFFVLYVKSALCKPNGFITLFKT